METSEWWHSTFYQPYSINIIPVRLLGKKKKDFYAEDEFADVVDVIKVI